MALTWAAGAVATQFLMAWASNSFLRDPLRLSRIAFWERRVFAASIVAAAAFGSISILFYIPGDRTNNLLMTAIPVGTVASMMAMTAPYLRLMFFASLPHALYLLSVPLLFEPAPFNIIFAALCVL
ncbi:MAG TPA: hypothetical protein DCL54_09365, partial [Alphaproteobacteria bacterium]|nr:hypothetical protein [Alphaproteobacteria bacterium]